MATTIHIGIAFDRNYLSPFYALAHSIQVNHSPGEVILHCIATGITTPEKNNILDFFHPALEIRFYNIDPAQLADLVLNAKWSTAVYYRLLFPELVGVEIGKLLYLDCDTLCVGNLRPLYELDFSEPVAAASDTYVRTQPLLGITEPGAYFNSGVMVMNLPVWSENKISELTLKYLRDYPERILFVDQCGLNAVLANRWKLLPEQANLMFSSIPQARSTAYYQDLLKDVVILHYTLQRPWELSCSNPYRGLYWKSLRETPGRGQAYTDAAWKNYFRWLKINVLEWYFNFPALQVGWQFLKGILKPGAR